MHLQSNSLWCADFNLIFAARLQISRNHIFTPRAHKGDVSHSTIPDSSNAAKDIPQYAPDIRTKSFFANAAV
jgi:hypothetical protein